MPAFNDYAQMIEPFADKPTCHLGVTGMELEPAGMGRGEVDQPHQFIIAAVGQRALPGECAIVGLGQRQARGLCALCDIEDVEQPGDLLACLITGFAGFGDVQCPVGTFQYGAGIANLAQKVSHRGAGLQRWIEGPQQIAT